CQIPERGAIRNRVASSNTPTAVVEEVAVETKEATPESAIEE
ncbi:TPA: preprotein translocase subunit YajC, partial [Streptococcus suis]|nr:preprotein translocase subunit YajC [Streptococcus suis]